MISENLNEINLSLKSLPFIERIHEELNRTQKNIVIYNYTPPDGGIVQDKLDHIKQLAPDLNIQGTDIETLGKTDDASKTPQYLLGWDQWKIEIGSWGA